MKESTPIISHFFNKRSNALCKTKSLRIKGFKLLNYKLRYKTVALCEERQNSAIGIHQQRSTYKVSSESRQGISAWQARSK
jgi:hypothetical protein